MVTFLKIKSAKLAIIFKIYILTSTVILLDSYILS